MDNSNNKSSISTIFKNLQSNLMLQQDKILVAGQLK